jgi:aspartyl-tRNA(Asn)/glutamyl-tRNA(Gln) amidotransferase subunit C
MKISFQETKHIALLSRLSLSAEELELMGRQLNNILGYIDKLNELDTTGVEPTSHVVPLENVFRDDVVRPSLQREMTLMNAPDRTEGFFRVPKIIE